ncbi:MAG TPA: GGDEF domain-containing protein [Candidatus Omnitrophota bacterium]|nr:GGDEF domain-containing protein [Candidatus Omnitrophota bacterium]
MALENTVRVSANPLSALFRSNLHLVGPEITNQKNLSKGPADLGIGHIYENATGIDRIMRERVLRLDLVDGSSAVKLDPASTLRIANSLGKSVDLSELLERTVEQIGFRFKAMVDFELRTDALDPEASDRPLHELMPNLFGKDHRPIDIMLNTRQPHFGKGADGEQVITLPIFDRQKDLLGAFRLRTWVNYSKEDLELLLGLSDTVGIAANSLVEKEKLRQLSITDGLTQLYNRRCFEEMISNHFASSRRTGKPLGLLVIDIDHFKRVNDTEGHISGDRVLKRVSLAIKRVVRASDIVARYGGEEIAVVMPETSLEGSRILAGKIRAMIEALNIRYNGGKDQVTVSVGIGQLGNETQNTEALFHAADANVYKAKEAGRNQVIG